MISLMTQKEREYYKQNPTIKTALFIAEKDYEQRRFGNKIILKGDTSDSVITYYYDFNNPIILEENNNNQEISDNDIIRGSIFLIKSVINELIIHTTYYPSDIKKIYLEFLNTKENQMIEKLQELKRPETKILAKVI